MVVKKIRINQTRYHIPGKSYELFVSFVHVYLSPFMRKHNFLLILFLLLASTDFLQAQSESNDVNLAAPDKKRLEVSTYNAVNKLRLDKKLPILLWDEVLYRAAIDHAQYLIRESKISHFQTTKGKKTPAERVKIHGGSVYTITGENIVAVTLGTQIDNKGINQSTVTYEAAAATMAALWKNSPGHYKNIISKSYNYTALAVSYDNRSQRLIAVQVFGYSSTPIKPEKLPDYSEHLLNLPVAELPYHLKKHNPKNQKAIDAFKEITMDRGYITGRYKTAKKVFKGRRSGIVQEFIPLRQFDSSSTEFSMVPNRRNGLFELNGTLALPVYRRQLLKYSRKLETPTYYINIKSFHFIKKPPFYFVYPLLPNSTETEFNLFLIKNKCLESFQSYSCVPSKLLETPFPELDLIIPFKYQPIPDKYRITYTYDTLKFKLYYTSGQVMPDSTKQQEITNTFNTIKGKITSVRIAAFASIEGSKESNDLLTKARMENFMNIVKPYLDTITIQLRLITQEQWKLFYKQLDGTRLEFLKKMQPDEIRKYVNEHTSDTLLTYLLNQQRYLNVSLIYKQEFKEKIKVKTPTELFDSLKTEYNKYSKPKQELTDALEKNQLIIYSEYATADSTAGPKTLPVLSLPNEDRYPVFRYHELMYQYAITGSVSDKEFYDRLHVLGMSKYFPARLKNELLFNNLVVIYKTYTHEGSLNNLMTYANIDNTMYRKNTFFLRKSKGGKKHHNKATLLYPKDYFVLKELPAFIALSKKIAASNLPEDSLWKYYYVYTIHTLYPFIPMHPEINKMVTGIKKYYHPNDAILTDSQRLELAYFYVAIKKYDIAQGLIEPIATRPAPNIEGLKLYIALRYEDYTDQHEFITYLISQYPRLGKTEWCDLWTNPNYLNFLLLEDLKLKEFYNCNCDR